MVKEFKKSYNLVYIKCHEAAINLNFKVKYEDIAEGIILFDVGMSLISWGEKFKIVITSVTPNLTRVEIASEAAFSLQIIDWGKNNENISKFFEELNSLFNP
ncbi:MAG: hypothetical protein MUC81_08360 [Bacteroidia bacterium]|jgi:hypothetical protein|nr:hypothetical protein [Bacteroidia bacterium]